VDSLGTRAQSPSFYERPPSNAATDFPPVVLVADQSIILVARKDFPSDNLQQFIAYANRRNCSTARPEQAARIISPAWCSTE
jgi:hypothetical protein